MAIIHRETTHERINAINQVIADLLADIAQLRDERDALMRGEISLRSLGLERIQLYPLWRVGIFTVEAYQCRERPIPGLGEKGKAVIAQAIAAYKGD